MATIDDLPIPNFSNLSDEEAIELILKVRERRLAGMTAPPKLRRTTKSKPKKHTKRSTEKLLEGMTLEQLEQIMERMVKRGA